MTTEIALRAWKTRRARAAAKKAWKTIRKRYGKDAGVHMAKKAWRTRRVKAA